MSLELRLSRIMLNVRDRAVQRDLSNCHQLHRTVMSAFPAVERDGAAPRSQLGVLFRVDSAPDQMTLVVQSAVEPTWRLPTGYLSERPDAAAVTTMSPFLTQALAQDRVLRFRLAANVTRKIETKTGDDGTRRNGRRVPVRPGEELEWLHRKAAAHGFQLVTATYQPLAIRGSKRSEPGQHASTRVLHGVTFDGRLRVVEPSAVRDAIGAGIGPGKAYGLGLLSVAL